MNKSKQKILSFFIILYIFIGIFFYFSLFRLVLVWDAISLFSPYFTLIADFSRSFKFLLWNPWSNCGSPDMAYVEFGSFSPYTILVAFITGGGTQGFLLYWLSIWMLGGIGMLLLSYHLRTSTSGSLIVTVSFLFSGFYLGNATYTSWLYGYSFLPLIIWRLDTAIKNKSFWPAIEAGTLYGVSALAGHPAIIIINGLFLMFWGTGRQLSQSINSNNKTLKKHSINILLIELYKIAILFLSLLTTSLIVLAPTYFAFFSVGTGYSDRVGYLNKAYAIGHQALPLQAIATFSSPYLSTLKLRNPDLFPNIFPGLTSCYIGSLVLIFAIMALWTRRHKFFNWWLLGIAFIFLSFALGPLLPLRGWLYEICLPTRFFRHSAVFRAYFILAVSILALYGFRAFFGLKYYRQTTWRTLFIISSITAILSVFAYLLTIQNATILGKNIILSNILFVIIWLFVPIIFFLGWISKSNKIKIYLKWLLIIITITNAYISFYLSEPLIYTSANNLIEKINKNRITSVNSIKDGFLRFRYPQGKFLMNDNLYSKTQVLENYNQLNTKYHSKDNILPLQTSWSDEPVLYKRIIGKDNRIWFSESPEEIPRNYKTFLSFVKRANELGKMPLVIHSPKKRFKQSKKEDNIINTGKILLSLSGATKLNAKLYNYTPTFLEFDVNCPENGWIMIGDRWSKGWQATVNSQSTDIWIGNFIFRAIKVKKGLNRISFKFNPYGYPWLIILSWSTIFLVICISIYKFKKK